MLKLGGLQGITKLNKVLKKRFAKINFIINLNQSINKYKI